MNGVRVNGSLLTPGDVHPLRHGDQVIVGPNEDYVWKFEEEQKEFKVPFSPMEDISNTRYLSSSMFNDLA